MLQIKLGVDVRGPLRLVQRELPNAVPYVEAALLTGLARRVQEKIKAQLPVSFDRPTPFTTRGVFVKKALKSEPVAEVYFPESTEERGKPKREYIRPGAMGAPRRNQKKTEYLLSKTGFLPPGWVTTPGSTAEKGGYIDAYGNVKPRTYAQIINVLQLKRAETKRARGISAASAKRAKRMGTDVEFFAVKPGKNNLGDKGSWLPPGVYRRVGKKRVESLQQILKFVKKATYRPLIDIESIARKEIAESLKPEFDKAFAGVKQRFALQDAKRAAAKAAAAVR